MGRWITRFWENTHEGGLRRRDQRSGEYRAYVPDPLVGAALVLSPGTEALAARAEARVRALGALPDMAGIARFLLRSEAIASSRIEGVAPSVHRVALAELAQQEEVRGLSEQARAVARNVTLVRAAVEELSGARPVTADRLLALHRSLLPDSPEHHGIRSTQNWVGGSSYHPLDADFVPPPPELVPDLVADLLTYLNGATHAPLIQAALVHAQFETIHPFADGNGRVGRALIHTVLTRRGLLAGMILPTSLALSTLSDEYVEALSRFREAGDPGGPDAESHRPDAAGPDGPDALGDPGGLGKSGDPNGPSGPGGPGGPNEPGESDGGRDAWISFFLGAVVLACDQAERISAELADVREEWNESLQKWVAREGGGRAMPTCDCGRFVAGRPRGRRPGTAERRGGPADPGGAAGRPGPHHRDGVEDLRRFAHGRIPGPGDPAGRGHPDHGVDRGRAAGLHGARRPGHDHLGGAPPGEHALRHPRLRTRAGRPRRARAVGPTADPGLRRGGPGHRMVTRMVSVSPGAQARRAS